LLRDLLAEVVPQQRQYGNALDVGCGTGLAGLAFHAKAERLAGIDLSPAMLAKAQEKGVYDTLVAGDAIELIKQSADAHDLVLCVDTLPYIGELPPLFKALAAHTAPGGHFLCSTELAEGGNYALQTSARFAHSPGYVIECAAAAGFDLLAQKTIPLRKDRVGWTSGGIYCFVRRA
jgi:predicted TPR repeat methyltransferase